MDHVCGNERRRFESNIRVPEDPRADQKSSRNVKIIVSTVFLVLIVTVASSLFIRGLNIGQNLAGTPETKNDGNSQVFSGEAGSIEEIANKLSPSVVSVLTTSISAPSYFFAQTEVCPRTR